MRSAIVDDRGIHERGQHVRRRRRQVERAQRRYDDVEQRRAHERDRRAAAAGAYDWKDK